MAYHRLQLWKYKLGTLIQTMDKQSIVEEIESGETVSVLFREYDQEQVNTLISNGYEIEKNISQVDGHYIVIKIPHFFQSPWILEMILFIIGFILMFMFPEYNYVFLFVKSLF